jgi:hypothetical protein
MTQTLSGNPQITGISYNGVLLQSDLTLTKNISGQVILNGYGFRNTTNVLISADNETAYTQLTSISIFDNLPPVSGQLTSFNILNDNQIEINGINIYPGGDAKIRFIPYNIVGYDFSDLSYLDVLSGRGIPTTFINIPPQLNPFEGTIYTLGEQDDYSRTGNTLTSLNGPRFAIDVTGLTELTILSTNTANGLSATTKYPYKSLYYLDDIFITKSRDFIYPLPESRIYKLNREYYNELGRRTTDVFFISGGITPPPPPIILDSIATTWQTISSTPNPNGEEDKFRFLNFEGGENTGTELISGEWNTEWWGYSARDLYNFSGVSYNIRGPGKPGNYKDENNVTLITPRHGVCNEHWGSGEDPKVGDSMYFYDHTTGMSVSAEVEAISATEVDDIRMIKYDRDLTALGDIKVYKLPLFTTLINANTFCTIYQGGNGPFGTGSSDRHAGLGTHSSITDVVGTPLFDTQLGATDLWSVSSIFTGTYFALSSLAVGDSSSPTFIIYNNDILLASSFWFGNGSGPNYGLSAIQAVLSSGIETLGNSEGYILSTVELP